MIKPIAFSIFVEVASISGLNLMASESVSQAIKIFI